MVRRLLPAPGAIGPALTDLNRRKEVASVLAVWLIARERGPLERTSPAAFSVCEKMCQPLKTLAGTEGIRSLLTRALVIAKAEAPSLTGVRIDENGCVDTGAAALDALQSRSGEEGGEVLVTTVLALLITFIGELLTLRFLQGVWPDLPIESFEPEKRGSDVQPT
jgi:hypothetical protein